MAAKMCYLVTLATGRQGASTAAELIKHGKIVHAFVKDMTSPRSKALESLGCVLFEGNLDDKSAIEQAIKGVTGIFLNLQPAQQDPEAEIRQTRNVLELASSSKTVRSIVVSTGLKSGKLEDYLSHDPNYYMASYHRSKKAVEDAVRASDIQYKTYLRPAWLMHNYIEPMWRYHFKAYQSEHTLDVVFPPGTHFAHLDAADVGKFAAAAFINPDRFNGEVIELGNEQLTIEDVARTIENATGVKIKTKYLNGEEDLEVAKTYYTYGMWEWALREDYFLTNPRDLDQYQIHLTTFEEFARREVDGFRQVLNATKE